MVRMEIAIEVKNLTPRTLRDAFAHLYINVCTATTRYGTDSRKSKDEQGEENPHANPCSCGTQRYYKV